MRLGQDHISFETAKIGSLVDIQDSEDPEGLRVMYYLVQDLKVSSRSFESERERLKANHIGVMLPLSSRPQCFVQSLLSLNFRLKPIG